MEKNFPLSLASLGAFILAGAALAQTMPSPSDTQEAHPAQIVSSPSDQQSNTCTPTAASAEPAAPCPVDDAAYGHAGGYRAPVNSMTGNGNTGAGTTATTPSPVSTGTAPMVNGMAPMGNGMAPMVNGMAPMGNGTASKSVR